MVQRAPLLIKKNHLRQHWILLSYLHGCLISPEEQSGPGSDEAPRLDLILPRNPSVKVSQRACAETFLQATGQLICTWDKTMNITDTQLTKEGFDNCLQ